MKNFTLSIALMLMVLGAFAQKITRGPDVGEIYFLGPTHTGTGLYYSTDYGETAICVDSIKNILTIAGDKTAGSVYCIGMPSNLYYSDNYGYSNSWTFKNSNINYSINSGRIEGEIYASFYKHSNDFGSIFIFHTCNGYFGDRIDNEIDNETDKGYIVVYETSVPDTIYLLFSNDNFENIQVQNTFFKDLLVEVKLTRGKNFGEIYINLIGNSFIENWLLYSNNYGQTFDTIDKFNLGNFYTLDIEGGRQEGEIYILYNFVNQMWLNAHIYIYHSVDYGQTFNVYHPFAKGNEPVLANFSTIDKEVHITSPVEFFNFSIGDIQEYQWDFENDGTIDSYEENPIFIYADTGWFSVKLSVVGLDSTNTFVKEDYIHVIDTLTTIISVGEELREVKIYPNPAHQSFSIDFSACNSGTLLIELYSVNGRKVQSKSAMHKSGINRISFDIPTDEGNKLPPGLYIVKLSSGSSEITEKVVLW